MKVSLNWIKFVNDKYECAADPAAGGVDELVEKIGAQLGAVDEVIDLGKKYQGAVIAKVVDCVKHPNADKLSVCLLDDGGVTRLKRDKNGLVQVVCGAPNVAAGQTVVWLPPGVTVPSSVDKDPLVLEARDLRGVVSNGMIASAKELALGDDHTGILVLDDDVKPGQDFAKAYGLDDHIIDIENKMFTHRPDLFGLLGIGRELAGIQHKPFKSPAWYVEDADIHNDGRKNVLKLSVKNELPKLVPRFTAVAIKDVKLQDSPAWLKIRLASVGLRPINNIVDLTNFFMLETGQPLHAYDYDKVKTGVLGVRAAKDGEKVTVIGGKDIKLKAGVIVITDGNRPIGLGGVMGGADTEVDAGTKNIILEVANFDMNTTRRTAMEYGLYTDATTRFTKNQSSRQQRAVLCKAVDDIKRLAGGRVASPIIDINHAPAKPDPVKLSADFINSRLGLGLTVAEIKKLLENVEFEIKTDNQDIEVTAPFWRTDIEIPEDIVEEVGRLYGYDQLPLTLPSRTIQPAEPNPELAFKARVREFLAAAGANEVLTYSFIHSSLADKAGQDSQLAYRIRNALSPDLQLYRLSLLPSLLDKVHANIKTGYDEFGLFEMGRTHIKGVNEADDLPAELTRLGFVQARKTALAGAAYYHARWFMDGLLLRLGVTSQVAYRPLEAAKLDQAWSQAAATFEPARSAAAYVGDRFIGLIGEPTVAVKQTFKLPAFTAMFEVDLAALAAVASAKTYFPLNRYPASEQDITLAVATDLPVGRLSNLIDSCLDKLHQSQGYIYSASIIDIYQKAAATKHVSWRITLAHPERTLTTAEVNKIFGILEDEAKKDFNAERV